MKCWDIGGQEQYRSEWSRYTKGCDVVLYVVDAAAPQKLPTARKELHKLLDDGSIGTTPMLVLANKIDLPNHVGEQELIEELALNYVVETPWMVLPISALRKFPAYPPPSSQPSSCLTLMHALKISQIWIRL